MEISGTASLCEFIGKNSNIELPIACWVKLMRTANYDNFEEIHKTFPKAYQDGKFTVFPVGGSGSFVILARISYKHKTIYIREISTFVEYEQQQTW